MTWQCIRYSHSCGSCDRLLFATANSLLRLWRAEICCPWIASFKAVSGISLILDFSNLRQKVLYYIIRYVRSIKLKLVKKTSDNFSLIYQESTCGFQSPNWTLRPSILVQIFTFLSFGRSFASLNYWIESLSLFFVLFPKRGSQEESHG